MQPFRWCSPVSNFLAPGHDTACVSQQPRQDWRDVSDFFLRDASLDGTCFASCSSISFRGPALARKSGGTNSLHLGLHIPLHLTLCLLSRPINSVLLLQPHQSDRYLLLHLHTLVPVKQACRKLFGHKVDFSSAWAAINREWVTCGT